MTQRRQINHKHLLLRLRSRRGGKPVEKGGKPAKVQTTLEKTLQKANVLETLYKDSDGDATELLTSMQSDTSYASEKRGYHTELADLQKEVTQAKKKDEFYSEFLLKKFAHVKEEYDKDTLIVKLTSIVADVEDPVKNLASKVEEILMVVQARLKVTRVKRRKA